MSALACSIELTYVNQSKKEYSKISLLFIAKISKNRRNSIDIANGIKISDLITMENQILITFNPFHYIRF